MYIKQKDALPQKMTIDSYAEQQIGVRYTSNFPNKWRIQMIINKSLQVDTFDVDKYEIEPIENEEELDIVKKKFQRYREKQKKAEQKRKEIATRTIGRGGFPVSKHCDDDDADSGKDCDADKRQEIERYIGCVLVKKNKKIIKCDGNAHGNNSRKCIKCDGNADGVASMHCLFCATGAMHTKCDPPKYSNQFSIKHFACTKCRDSIVNEKKEEYEKLVAEMIKVQQKTNGIFSLTHTIFLDTYNFP